MSTREIPSIRRGWFRRKPATAANEVVYAIGDIHGRFDLFWKLIQAMEVDFVNHRRKGRVRIIVLGDFIDRGPDSARLIHIFNSMHTGNVPIEVLKGNHEALLLDSFAGDERAQRLWLKTGGAASLASFGLAPPLPGEDPIQFAGRMVQRVGTNVVNWLRDLPSSSRSGDYFFCHAGVKPGVLLKRQAQDDMLWIRNRFLKSRRNHGAVIVHGHTVVETVEVLSNRINLDTGAYRSHILSAICLDGTSRHIITT